MPELPEEHIKLACLAGGIEISLPEQRCSFLILGVVGFECAKGSSVESLIRERRPTMKARGDNCSGPPDFKIQTIG